MMPLFLKCKGSYAINGGRVNVPTQIKRKYSAPALYYHVPDEVQTSPAIRSTSGSHTADGIYSTAVWPAKPQASSSSEYLLDK